jgi:hypothetical protein
VPYHPAATPRRAASSVSTWRDNSIVIKNSDQVIVVPMARLAETLEELAGFSIVFPPARFASERKLRMPE